MWNTLLYDKRSCELASHLCLTEAIALETDGSRSSRSLLEASLAAYVPLTIDAVPLQNAYHWPWKMTSAAKKTKPVPDLLGRYQRLVHLAVYPFTPRPRPWSSHFSCGT